MLSGLLLAVWMAVGATTQQVPETGQGPAVVQPPPTIAAEGVPAVPLALARGLSRYQNIRSATFADWGPQAASGALEGEFRQAPMIVLTRFADTNQVHRVDFAGGARSQVSFHPERVTGAQTRPGHPEVLFEADEGGAENYQLYLIPQTSGEAVRLSDGRSRNMGPRWSPSGKLLAFSSNARNGRDMDLYVADPSQPGQARLFKEVSGSWTIEDWSPEESRVVAIEYVSINESYVHIVEIGTGKTETLIPRREAGAVPVAYEHVRWAKDGRSLYWTTDAASEFRQLVRLDLADKKSTVLTRAIPWDVEEFDIASDGKTIVLAANEGGISKLHVLDAGTGQEGPAPQMPAGVISNLKFQPATRQFGFSLASARNPSDAYTFDLNTWSWTRWTVSETAGFDTATFTEPALIQFASFDGKSIPAFLYRPDPARHAGKRPVVINIHGGPEAQFRPNFLGRVNTLLNDQGIALIYPNVRGSNGYGKTYLGLDNGFKREDSVRDIGALLDWIKAQPDLDSERVGVVGGSYGGVMSLAVQTTYNDRIRAGIDIVGISNFVTFLEHTQEYRRDLRRAEYGDEREPDMRVFLEKISPLGQAQKIKTPILVVQGANDPRVPLSEAEQMVAAVRKNQTPLWYVVGKNEGHGFAKKPNQDYLQAVEVLFWKTFLLGETR